ncbi:MAG: cation:proton antiporter [Candidatus ainarchaeum sp.]|nr:cation:proton antiporter [Candidatus ainarchaeum sp.]
MISVEFAFLLIAFIILVGYLGLIIFQKTKISEIIILLTLGLIIGPISKEIGFLLISPSQLNAFQAFLPFFASFALIMILFEGGMQLNFFKTIKALPVSIVFTIAIFLTGLIMTIGILWLFGQLGLFEFNLLLAIFIGSILGGTSSAVIVPVVKNTSAHEETKTLLSLESALTDALCIITAVAVAEIFLLGSVTVEAVAGGIMANFSIAAVIGFCVGIVWLKIVSFLQGKKYEYLITLSALLFLYSTVQMIGGNGAIAALIFGIVLGNSEDVTSMLKITRRTIDTNVKNFQGEISFLVKTFFFVYLGILFKLDYLTLPVIVISISIIGAIFVSRQIISTMLKKFIPIFTKDQKLISFMSARGLAAAVLVSIPITMGLDKIAPEVFSLTVISQITAISFLVIFGTNILTTIGIFITEKENPTVIKTNEKENILKEIKADLLKNKKN